MSSKDVPITFNVISNTLYTQFTFMYFILYFLKHFSVFLSTEILIQFYRIKKKNPDIHLQWIYKNVILVRRKTQF